MDPEPLKMSLQGKEEDLICLADDDNCKSLSDIVEEDEDSKTGDEEDGSNKENELLTLKQLEKKFDEAAVSADKKQGIFDFDDGEFIIKLEDNSVASTLKSLNTTTLTEEEEDFFGLNLSIQCPIAEDAYPSPQTPSGDDLLIPGFPIPFILQPGDYEDFYNPPSPPPENKEVVDDHRDHHSKSDAEDSSTSESDSDSDVTVKAAKKVEMADGDETNFLPFPGAEMDQEVFGEGGSSTRRILSGPELYAAKMERELKPSEDSD